MIKMTYLAVKVLEKHDKLCIGSSYGFFPKTKLSMPYTLPFCIKIGGVSELVIDNLSKLAKCCLVF